MATDRRVFIKKALAISASSLLPVKWVFADGLPKGITPLDISSLTWNTAAELPDYFTILNSNPLNAFPEPFVLDPVITPASAAFTRWNGKLPEFDKIDVNKWTFKVDGESVKQSKTYTIDELKKRFKNYTMQLTIECGGNGRGEFFPNAKGNQWGNTAVFCSKWTGVLVKDVIADCGVKSDAVYTGHHGIDMHLSGKSEALSRGVPIKIAMTDDSALIAWEMNGEDIPYIHGYPLRIVYGGRVGSASQKCAIGMSIRDKVHDGRKMAAPAYQVPKYPVAPGEKVEKKDFKIIEEMIVKSLITNPPTATEFKLGKSINLRGHAWAGLQEVTRVDVSYDYGSTWRKTKLTKPVNITAWQQWNIDIDLPQAGYYEIWARATDSNGLTQPVVQPQWNPKGYLFNGCHRIAIRVV